MVRRSWRTQLKASTSPESVLSVVSQYLEEWSREEVAALPADAWPVRLVTKADLLAHAVRLGTLHAHFEGDAAALMGLQELLLFFTHAAVRISQLEVVLAVNAPSHGAEAEGSAAARRKKPVAGSDG